MPRYFSNVKEHGREQGCDILYALSAAIVRMRPIRVDFGADGPHPGYVPSDSTLFEVRPRGRAKDLITQCCIRTQSRLRCTVSESGSTQQRGGTAEIPALSTEQHAIWSGNKDIAFYSQDEDICR
jgi:hypothetical protein